METQEERVSNAPWQIRCSPEQKRSFQKFVEGTGMNASDAIMQAFEAFKIQNEEENSESKKVLLEADSLIMRLQTMLRSQLLTAIEKQKQCSEEKNSLEEEKTKYYNYYADIMSKLEKEFEEKKGILEKNFEEKLKNFQDQFEVQVKNKELECMNLNEKYEKLESDFQRLERDKNTLQKQYTESMRLYEISDERLMECRQIISELQEKLKNFDATKERNNVLERELTIQQVKFDSLIKEEALKREYLEKDLRREFDMKFMQLNQSGH